MIDSNSKLKILPMIFFGMHHTVKIVFHASGLLSTTVVSMCLHMMSQKFEESTHNTLFDGQKLNC